MRASGECDVGNTRQARARLDYSKAPSALMLMGALLIAAAAALALLG